MTGGSSASTSGMEAGARAGADARITAGEVQSIPVKRRRIDANAILCPFELNGVCNDDDCR